MAPPFNEPEFRRTLARGLLDVLDPLSGEQFALAAAHAKLLLEWNAVAGLTKLVEPAELARRHFVESLLVASLVPASDGATRVLDVGSGGGFPGLAMRITRPELHVTLLEPRAKKAAFLRAAARLYPSPATRVVARRLEELVGESPWPVATLRGVRVPVSHLVRVTAPGSTVITLAGEHASEFLHDLAAAGFVLDRAVPIPGRDGHARAWRRAS